MSQPTQTVRIERHCKRWTCRNSNIKGEVCSAVPVLFLGEGSISVGANILFGWSHDPFFFDGGYILIDAHSAVLKGSRIGYDTVIGHVSLVSGEIPPSVLAAGRPTRTIRKLSDV